MLHRDVIKAFQGKTIKIDANLVEITGVVLDKRTMLQGGGFCFFVDVNVNKSAERVLNPFVTRRTAILNCSARYFQQMTHERVKTMLDYYLNCNIIDVEVIVQHIKYLDYTYER